MLFGIPTPPRMSIGNLLTGKSLEAQFNPTEFEEEVAPKYGRLQILGQSHEPIQYQNTQNTTFTFDLAWSAFDDRGTKLDDIQAARRYMLSLCYSSRSAQTVQAGQPADALFLWPTMVAIQAKLTKLKIKHQAFNAAGTTIRMLMSVQLEEARSVRLTAEDVLANGTMRSGGGGSGRSTAGGGWS